MEAARTLQRCHHLLRSFQLALPTLRHLSDEGLGARVVLLHVDELVVEQPPQVGRGLGLAQVFGKLNGPDNRQGLLALLQKAP